MYNNIGLQTPRGSGTSGYVSANKAKPRQLKSKLDFLKELKNLRENILPPPRKANKEILEHKQKREIYVTLAELRQKLKTEGMGEEAIEEKVKATETSLLEKYRAGVFKVDESQVGKDSHALAVIKEKEQEKLKHAFKIKGEYKYGSAFDFESQEKQRLEKLYKKEMQKIERLKKEKEDAKRAKKDKKEKKARSRSREKQAEQKDTKSKKRRSSTSSSKSSSSSSSSSSG